MKKVTILMLLGITLLTAACGTKENDRSAAVYEKKFTLSNFNDVATLVKGNKDISSEDVVLLTNALKRLVATKDSIIGKTVKQLIENELRYVRDYSDAQFADVANICMLRVNTESKFLGVLPADGKDGKSINNLYFEFKNNMNKSFKSIAGEIQFYFRQDSTSAPIPVKPIKFNFEKEIAAHSVDTLIFYQPYSPTDDVSELLRTQTSHISGVINVFDVK